MSAHNNTASSECRVTSECLERLQAGDQRALNDLLEVSARRIQELTRTIKRSYPVVGRWEQTEDVAQNATIRLARALSESEIQSAEHFFNLVALQIRRELIDLARRHAGPEGLAANHQTQRGNQTSQQGDVCEQLAEATRSGDPQDLFEWVEFHENIEKLPTHHRMMFDLLWYHDLSQQEAANVTGQSIRTVKRRWRDAKLALHEMIQGLEPSDRSD